MSDQNCRELSDAERQHHMLNDEVHDYHETNHELAFQTSKCAVYKTVEKCAREGCDAGKTGSEVVGQAPDTEQELANLVYELYESLYEDPRAVPMPALYPLITAESDKSREVAQMHLLIDAVEIGCRDARESKDKKTKSEFLDFVYE
jgi:hypothetical protein